MDEDSPTRFQEFQANLNNPDAKENQIFKILLSSIPYKKRIVNVDNYLLISLQYSDIIVSRKLYHRGANLLFREFASSYDLDGYLGYRTTLSVIYGYIPVPGS